jgi:hypothetical protein
MSEHLLFPLPKLNAESLENLVMRCHELAKKSEVVFLSEHAKERMLERNITNRQIFDVLRNGMGISGPDLYRTRLKNRIFGFAKASGFNDHKWVHISNIDPFMIVKSRELSLTPKTDF